MCLLFYQLKSRKVAHSGKDDCKNKSWHGFDAGHSLSEKLGAQKLRRGPDTRDASVRVTCLDTVRSRRFDTTWVQGTAFHIGAQASLWRCSRSLRLWKIVEVSGSDAASIEKGTLSVVSGVEETKTTVLQAHISERDAEPIAEIPVSLDWPAPRSQEHTISGEAGDNLDAGEAESIKTVISSADAEERPGSRSHWRTCMIVTFLFFLWWTGPQETFLCALTEASDVLPGRVVMRM